MRATRIDHPAECDACGITAEWHIVFSDSHGESKVCDDCGRAIIHELDRQVVQPTGVCNVCGGIVRRGDGINVTGDDGKHVPVHLSCVAQVMRRAQWQ